ncbi:TetR/AcrR family transcriptional regulator [Aquimarina sp. ERC-38]|uniref:TetR/AcrR family transcriptional regulator n=1 Tax=Aquimarina sp. ERC-38 TaxID=2949996 RepID=UPI0022484722|nr:TetR/AcrR family transcriptional regulator [Aquimarina sp. ERC-38]UZO80213.1 TetR/AcrR family transcriptional regulator [Aquimarina sp. ERC-38]
MPKVETFNREEIVVKAMQVFHDKGYNGTSMQDLVDSTGLNRSSIYNSFGNKLEMFVEVLKYYENLHATRTQKELTSVSNPKEMLRLLFKLLLQDVLKNPDKKGCMIVNCKSEMANCNSTVKRFLTNNQNNMLKMLQDILEKGVQQKVFNNKKTTTQYALYLLSAIQGFRMTSILNKNENELRAIIDTILVPINN